MEGPLRGKNCKTNDGAELGGKDCASNNHRMTYYENRKAGKENAGDGKKQ